MIEADPNRSFVVDVFDAGSNSKVSLNFSLTNAILVATFSSVLSLLIYFLIEGP